MVLSTIFFFACFLLRGIMYSYWFLTHRFIDDILYIILTYYVSEVIMFYLFRLDHSCFDSIIEFLLLTFIVVVVVSWYPLSFKSLFCKPQNIGLNLTLNSFPIYIQLTRRVHFRILNAIQHRRKQLQKQRQPHQKHQKQYFPLCKVVVFYHSIIIHSRVSVLKLFGFLW